MLVQNKKCNIAWAASHPRDNFGITIRTKNTVVMHQPAVLKQSVKPTGTEKGQRLEVNKFTYLDSTFSRAVHSDDY